MNSYCRLEMLAVLVMQLTKEGISGTFRGVVSDIGRMTSDGVTTLGTMSFQQFKPTEWKASNTARFLVCHTVQAMEILLLWQHMMHLVICAHAYTSGDLHTPLHACTAGLVSEINFSTRHALPALDAHSPFCQSDCLMTPHAKLLQSTASAPCKRLQVCSTWHKSCALCSCQGFLGVYRMYLELNDNAVSCQVAYVQGNTV